MLALKLIQARCHYLLHCWQKLSPKVKPNILTFVEAPRKNFRANEGTKTGSKIKSNLRFPSQAAPVYHIDDPLPTFLKSVNSEKSKTLENSQIQKETAPHSKETENYDSQKFTHTAQSLLHSNISSIGRIVRNKHNRQVIVAKDFIIDHIRKKEQMKSQKNSQFFFSIKFFSTFANDQNGVIKNTDKMPREKYSNSPFGFIDKVEKGEIQANDFVYLKKIGPYDLQIIPSSQIERQHYYTLSSSGLTCFIDDIIIFTPLDMWQREYYLYTSIMEVMLYLSKRSHSVFCESKYNITFANLQNIFLKKDYIFSPISDLEVL
ncbi:hypothetical protein RFI_05358 [Reticulomyxa filosa]|uniref:Uncharacterized protein n=1 Tax=Reticulomyxa filosa TaxID=46433 RepID=X6P0V5_RETFI|nr:hypothetical protein RFI_05358 [Reticulomyxa filosa]|eukprot:ETO31763.1 hypothetical protein RFI_05358 [Reticulomyxa filosa]